VELWDVKTGKGPVSFVRHAVTPWALAFSPDGRILASGTRDYLTFHDIQTRQLLDAAKHAGGLTWALAFSPDGNMLASGSHDTIMLWDVLYKLPASCETRPSTQAAV
jgi:WD40 repeat protein